MVAKQQPNHVIFLGAGASYSSGYPIGDGLRLLLACPNHFRERLRTVYGAALDTDLSKVCYVPFTQCRESADIFRRGGFATVDEFSKLASETSPQHVQNMKRLMRVALSLHNPEKEFHKSDYYPFVQRLFEKDLYSLKSNVTIITFNYDCYLDYLLVTAAETRQCFRLLEKELTPSFKNKLASGFWRPDRDLGWAKNISVFNYFKLHGSIAYGSDEKFGYRFLFGGNSPDRLKIFNEGGSQTVPPVVFPWEVFNDHGKFIDEDNFIFVKGIKEAKQQEGRILFRHFKQMWESAKEKLSRAEKISFVGLSMHDYLKDAFAYLFQDFSKLRPMNDKPCHIVVANKVNADFRDDILNPRSPAGRTAELLSDVAPGLAQISRGTFGIGPNPKPTLTDFKIVPRESFKDFIENEIA